MQPIPSAHHLRTLTLPR